MASKQNFNLNIIYKYIAAEDDHICGVKLNTAVAFASSA
jgi:hypothetical protein